MAENTSKNCQGSPRRDDQFFEESSKAAETQRVLRGLFFTLDGLGRGLMVAQDS